MTRLAPISRALVAFPLLLAACIGSSEPLPSGTPPRTLIPQPADPEVPPASPSIPPADPTPEPALPDQAKGFSISPADVSVPHQGKVTVELVNTTGETHHYHHPGGSSGCAAFQWRWHLIAEDGTVYDPAPDYSRRLCTAVMTPPSDHRFEAGEVAAAIEVDLSHRIRALEPDDAPAPFDEHALFVFVPPGRYRLVVTGANITAEARLTVH